MRVAIIGRNEILFETARCIIEHGAHEVVAIITAKARPEYLKTEEDFRRLAESNGIPFLLTEKIDAKTEVFIDDAKPDIGISINWVSVIRRDFIDRFPAGIINAHFGDLPRYRGNAVTNWALLRGEREIALTVHRMEPGELDSGDILLQRRMHLEDSTTIREINRFAEENVPGMFLDTLVGLESGSIKPLRQQDTGLSPFRCYPRLPMDGKIDWSMSARQIDQLVRSLARPYSGAYTFWRKSDHELTKLYIWRARVVQEETDDVGVPGHVVKNDGSTGESWIYTGAGILALIDVSSDMDGEIFQPGRVWKSIRMRLGMDTEEEVFALVKTIGKLSGKLGSTSDHE